MDYIDRLPYLCLLKIFGKLPLREQVRARAVCKRWNSLALYVTSKLESITLLVGGGLDVAANFRQRSSFAVWHAHELLHRDGSPMYAPEPVLNEYNSLSFHFLTVNTVLSLVDSFHSVSTLEIAIIGVKCCQLWPVATLLRLWAHNLVTLKLFCCFKFCHSIPVHVSRELFTALNLMASLRCLWLDFKDPFARSIHDESGNLVIDLDDPHEYDPEEETTEQIDLPILGQLEEFCFFSADSEERGDIMWQSLRQYAEPSQRLVRIQYGNSSLRENPGKLVQLDPAFCRKFVKLLTKDFHQYMYGTNLNWICNRFTWLTTATFFIKYMSMRQVLHHLEWLPHLTHLSLCFSPTAMNNNDWPRDNDDSDGEEDYADNFDPNRRPPIEPRRFPSLKVLRLAIHMLSHDDLIRFNLGWTFPEVQVMELQLMNITGFHCNLCQIDTGFYDGSRDKSPQERERCQRLLLQPLSEMPRLHKLTACNRFFGRQTINLVELRRIVE